MFSNVRLESDSVTTFYTTLNLDNHIEKEEKKIGQRPNLQNIWGTTFFLDVKKQRGITISRTYIMKNCHCLHPS